MSRHRPGRLSPARVIVTSFMGVILCGTLLLMLPFATRQPGGISLINALFTATSATCVTGLVVYDTFTGFKFMAEKKNQLESAGEGHVIFSYEESIGYMLGDYVRDKDAVTASLLLTEMTAWYAAQGMTLLDALDALYEKYGHYAEKTVNLVMKGLEGMANMKALMENLRTNPLTAIDETPVLTRRDYQPGLETDVLTGKTTNMELVGSNVLRYLLADGTDLIIRPSGTEPKIKVYVLATGENQTACQGKIDKYAAWAETLKK